MDGFGNRFEQRGFEQRGFMKQFSPGVKMGLGFAYERYLPRNGGEKFLSNVYADEGERCHVGINDSSKTHPLRHSKYNKEGFNISYKRRDRRPNYRRESDEEHEKFDKSGRNLNLRPPKSQKLTRYLTGHDTHNKNEDGRFVSNLKEKESSKNYFSRYSKSNKPTQELTGLNAYGGKRNGRRSYNVRENESNVEEEECTIENKNRYALHSGSQYIHGFDSYKKKDRRNAYFLKDVVPDFMSRYIEKCEDVEADGNCGFRTVARFVYGDESKWWEVRMDLMEELTTHRDLYERRCALGCEEMYSDSLRILDWHDRTRVAPECHWYDATCLGPVVATRYQRCFIFWGGGASVTFLPLKTRLIEGLPTGMIMSMARIRGNHFIPVYMSVDSPLPPVSMFWVHTCHQDVRHFNEDIKNQLHEYRKLGSEARGMKRTTEKVVELDSEDEEHIAETKIRSSYHSDPRKRTEQVADEEGSSEEELRKKPKRTPRLDFYGFDLIRSGRVARPYNPYFIARIRPKRYNELLVPATVVKSFGLNLPDEIVLCDEYGRKWTSKLAGRKGNVYMGGWRNLCGRNLIGNEDLCVCEFVNYKYKNVYIQVKVVRLRRCSMIQQHMIIIAILLISHFLLCI